MISRDQDTTTNRIDQLRVFTFWWALTQLFHLSQIRYPRVMFGELSFDSITLLLVTACSAALLFRSTSIRLLLAICFFYNVHFLYTLPNGVNHPVMFFLLNTAVLICYFWIRAKNSDTALFRKEFFNAFAPVGRYMLLIMYIFGIFQKLNTGWFDPEVSCGVLALDQIVVKVGLDGVVSDWIAIYGTLIVEGIAIIFLFTPRLKLIGFFLGISFHLIILTLPIAWFTGFTAMAIALYTMFLPQHYGDRLQKVLDDTAAYHRRIATGVVMIILLVAVILFAAHLYGPDSGSRFFIRLGLMSYYLFFHGFLLAIGIAFLLSILAFCYGYRFRNAKGFLLPRPSFILIVPLLFFVNNISPHVGLKTDGVVSMFSNLHTEGGVTNHILFDKPPYLFDYQSKLVNIIDASPEFYQWITGKATYVGGHGPDSDFEYVLVEFTFWDYLHKHPETVVTYEDDSGIHELNPAANALKDHPLPWLLRKLLVFKSVDFQRPKICTH